MRVFSYHTSSCSSLSSPSRLYLFLSFYTFLHRIAISDQVIPESFPIVKIARWQHAYKRSAAMTTGKCCLRKKGSCLSPQEMFNIISLPFPHFFYLPCHTADTPVSLSSLTSQCCHCFSILCSLWMNSNLVQTVPSSCLWASSSKKKKNSNCTVCTCIQCHQSNTRLVDSQCQVSQPKLFGLFVVLC